MRTIAHEVEEVCGFARACVGVVADLPKHRYVAPVVACLHSHSVDEAIFFYVNDIGRPLRMTVWFSGTVFGGAVPAALAGDAATLP
jgi:hypothetical protein